MSRPPSHYLWLQEHFPTIAKSYEELGRAAHAAGTLDERTRALLKVAISGAARLEGGLHSHVRKALAVGVKADEIYSALVLLIPTIGFPGAMAALAWARDVIEGTKKPS
jgi:4-carboxymuconolactone decarboxylase